MVKVKSHYRKVGTKRVRIHGYLRANPTITVKRHWRKAHERRATHVKGVRVHSHLRTY